jgi:protein gp37
MNFDESAWRREVWNPVTGCTKISAGCKYCSAERIAKTLRKNGVRKFRKGFALQMHRYLLKQPESWRKRRMVSVGTMTDIFHEKIPADFIDDMFRMMNDCAEHVFMLCTKRPERLAEIAPALRWTPNIWTGVTIESQEVSYRADFLRRIPSRVRYICFEPLIGEISDIDISGIDWAILGGETGRGSRRLHKEWAARLNRICTDADVPLFFTQWGSGHSAEKKKIRERIESNISINQLQMNFTT